MSNTWAPFQSLMVREICAHMTAAEKSAAAFRGGCYGLWVAATLACPVSLAVSTRSPLLLGFAALLVLTHLLCIPLWLKMQRQFFCSTAWAREQGITPERLSLFGTK
ncbi:MAG TPA: hypothetical protein VGE39_14180 [Prosthecobacter sp.]